MRQVLQLSVDGLNLILDDVRLDRRSIFDG